ncbi:carbon-nitrogen hydrolase family protein [Fodinicurvata sp. EGI_FJ10296]|uniref:carbon-nitrogen hydrolase family protein n=1 Tax=Fodinicurvata sp. EGI_FJ10296 TaxID=3231908 RepID=UPI0034564F64
MRIALAQQTPPGDADPLARLDALAAQAKSAGAALLVTPEMGMTGYDIGPAKVAERAEAVNGPIMTAVASIARRHAIAIVAGFPECAGRGKPYNAAALIDAGGHCLSVCRKTHLFGDVDRSQFTPGDALAQPVDLNGWRVSLAICYDIEFPEVARHFALQGVEAILVPTANMLPFVSIANRVVPVRAEENAVYVAYANYCGPEGRFDYCGLSCICGPDGNDLARAANDPALIVADLSKSTLAEVRSMSTHLADRRPDLYR